MQARGRAVSKVMKPFAKRFGASLHEIVGRWNEIAGEQVASFAVPDKLRRSKQGGVLTLRVRGPAAVLLQAEAPRLIDRINQAVGAGSVARLAYKQSAPEPLKTPHMRAPALDVTTQERLKASLAGVGDERLQRALMQMGRGALLRQAHRKIAHTKESDDI